MLGFKTNALRLLTQYVSLGGLAGLAVFSSQGEFTKAVWCIITAGFCILVLTLAILLAEWLSK